MSFLSLPSEIRLQIYSLVLGPSDPANNPAIEVPLATIRSHEPPLLRVNRKIRDESLYIWLSQHTFLTRTFVPPQYAQAVRHAHHDVEKYVGDGYGRWLEELGEENAKWTGKVVIQIVQYLAAGILVEIPARKVGDRDAWPRGQVKIHAAFDRPYQVFSETSSAGDKEKLRDVAVEFLNRSRKTGLITRVCEDVPKFVESIYEVISHAGEAEWEEYHPADR